jgi:eukaryotic-like serine/threonine-protein kinase
VAAVAAAVIAFLVPRTHHGAPPLPQAAPKPTPHQVTLCNSCAHDYNPDALSGPKDQHPNTVGLAIDGDRNSSWTTENYLNEDLGKPGVGLYVDAKPGVAAGSLVIDTETPGYAVSIYARHNAPDPNTFDGNWVKVGTAANVHKTQPIRLHTNGTRYRYYLVWITSLGNHNQVAINEIALYTR